MPHPPLDVKYFEGGSALSPFRAAGLLARLQQVHARIGAVSARFVHWVAFDAPPQRAALDKLEGLLAYGEPCRAAPEGDLVVVMPRLGTVSPWASKATDIARNCGLGESGLHRIERVVEYRLVLRGGLLGGARALDAAALAAVAALLHDRMTESVGFERTAA